MQFLDYIEKGFKLITQSLNFVVGIIVGAVFGALLSIIVILLLSDGFSFSEGWYWRLLPGVVLGAMVGIRFWPLMLGFFLGEDIASDFDASTDSADETDSTTNMATGEPNESHTDKQKTDQSNGW